MAHPRHSTSDPQTELEEYPVGLSTGIEAGSSSSNSSHKMPFENTKSGVQVETGSVREVSDSDGDVESAGGDEIIHHPADKQDILTHTIHVEDDPTIPALTFRTWFLGIGLALFGGTISAIYYFKPQTIIVSVVFIAVISYLLGEAMAYAIPRKGWLGRLLNPHPFNKKEHLAIVVMANAASISALGIELLAVERLYYGAKLNGGSSIFLLFSSQFLGYGIAGLMRKALLYPKNMLWPVNLPVNNMLEALHHNRAAMRKPLRVFLIVFACIFCWEIIPEWIMPILTGFSIFCLARPNSATFSMIFGGASGNEGLGLFSWCMDWQYISGGTSPLYFPMDALISMGVGTILCISLFSGVYFTNVWNAQNYPFLSQVLFSRQGNSTNFIQWNQTAVIGSDNRIDPVALKAEGLPAFAGSYVVNILTSNMAISAGIVHLLLYNWNDLKPVLEIFKPSNFRKIFLPRTWNVFSKDSANEFEQPQENYDPHYKLMLAYKPVPNWWFLVILVLSAVVALVVLYVGDSTLPWWGFLVACIVAWVLLLFFGAMQAVTGVGFIIQPIVQLVGGYLQPGNPVANMYFTLYGYNSVTQGSLLLSDLKLAQYGHLAPRVAFMMQVLGTFIGAVLNYVMMNSIVTNQREILLRIQGTNIWSGQNVQQYNTLAVAWGGLAHELFSVGAEYQWCTLSIILGFFAPLPFYALHRFFPNVGFNNINTSVLIYFGSYLVVGINSSVMNFFLIGLFSQYYLRKYHPNIFVRYNYIVSAALDGGTSVIVFIMSFAIFGAAGTAHNFPQWWGNNINGNLDRCLYLDD